jgi:hypothetical protein
MYFPVKPAATETLFRNSCRYGFGNIAYRLRRVQGCRISWLGERVSSGDRSGRRRWRWTDSDARSRDGS